MKIDFSGKVALVTGATKGIGKRIADDLSSLGATVICTGTRQAGVEQHSETSSKFERYFSVDFTDQKETKEFISFIESAERIDVCINNAGITSVAAIDEASEQDWTRVLAVNLEAPFLITRSVSRLMKSQGSGKIINISSIWGHISNFGRPIMSASKFGLRGLTVAVAHDLAPYGILVNDVAPGWTLTELCQKVVSDEQRSEVSQQIPVGRFAQPEEISRVVLFLASDLNTYITGQSIVVDGGYTML